MNFKTPLPRKYIAVLLAILILFSGPACTFTLFGDRTNGGTTPQPVTPTGPTSTPLPMAQVTFRVTLPLPLNPGETLALRVLDEVTGLSFNYSDVRMQAVDPTHFIASLPVTLNSVLKYIYIREGGPGTPEYNSLNQAVRYRLYFAAGTSEVTDIVAAWPDKPFIGTVGSIQGTAINADTGVAVPGLMVSASGVQSITDSAGRFNLQGLPVGTHNVIGYAMDGMFGTFQQGATVAQGLTTPVSVTVRGAPLVPVSLTVHVPANTQPGAAVRIAGNLLQLGNTFANLRGGLSTVADRMLPMQQVSQGIYRIDTFLPVGADVRYKYTLGDGFWNAEHKLNGGTFQVRQFIVPPGGLVLEEYVETWQAGNSAPILFEVTVPNTTPAGDIIYIQFNPYGWTEPIPMWFDKDNHWTYRLYGPLNLSSFAYRFCRSGQCGSADDVATAGSSDGRQAITVLTSQDLQDTVTNWAWMETPTSSVAGTNVAIRANNFMAGVEVDPYFHPNYTTHYPLALQYIQSRGANWVTLTPTWTYSSSAPLVFGVKPGADQLWTDTNNMIANARGLNLSVALFPQPRFPVSSSDWWRAAPRDNTWWLTWFDYYRAFAVNYADLATQAGAQALILGGDWVLPALPNGTLSDGSPSNVPNDADARWQAVLNEVRAHFRGTVLWAMPYTVPNLATPGFLVNTDGIYLLVSGTLSENSNPTGDDLNRGAAQLLDNGVLPLQSLLSKPVYIALAYPSATGATMTCLPINGATCQNWKSLSQPNNPPEVALNLQLQADIYQAIFVAVNTRPWVAGVVSRGFYPPTFLLDKSASIHGKISGDVVWYWYQRFLGLIK